MNIGGGSGSSSWADAACNSASVAMAYNAAIMLKPWVALEWKIDGTVCMHRHQLVEVNTFQQRATI